MRLDPISGAPLQRLATTSAADHLSEARQRETDEAVRALLGRLQARCIQRA